MARSHTPTSNIASWNLPKRILSRLIISKDNNIPTTIDDKPGIKKEKSSLASPG